MSNSDRNTVMSEMGLHKHTTKKMTELMDLRTTITLYEHQQLPARDRSEYQVPWRSTYGSSLTGRGTVSSL